MLRFLLKIASIISLTALYIILMDYIKNSGITERIHVDGMEYFLLIGCGFLIGTLYFLFTDRD